MVIILLLMYGIGPKSLIKNKYVLANKRLGLYKWAHPTIKMRFPWPTRNLPPTKLGFSNVSSVYNAARPSSSSSSSSSFSRLSNRKSWGLLRFGTLIPRSTGLVPAPGIALFISSSHFRIFPLICLVLRTHAF